MLKDRQKIILHALVEEYISSALPISSSQLVDKFHLPFSSATVRNEFLTLDEEGFLEQPHTSAGRVPTDKGLRLYVEGILKAREALAAEKRFLLSRLTHIHEEDEFLKQMARIVSEITEEFTLVGLHEDDIFYKAGIAEAMNEPEFADPKALKEFSELMDFIDEEMAKQFLPADFEEPHVFIGGDNPIREARNYGMIVSSVSTPKGRERLIAILGPRHMDYRKNVSLFQYLNDFFE